MKVLLFLLAFGSLSACEKKPAGYSKQEMMQETNIIDLVKKNDIAGVKSALDNGADVNTRDKKGRSLLLIATIDRQTEMAKLLVSCKADVNLQDDQLDSPFLYAGASGQTELVRLFLEHGARFDVFNRYNGTALIPACERGHVETVKVLVKTKGFPVNHINRLGWTALMEAVILGNGTQKYQEIVKILKDNGADLTIPDRSGKTPLQHAEELGFAEIAQILKS
ncbi:ankyrin repeat domain-containing protein [Chryseobacterium arthrosphaerae]|uniref:ankyrin repeat domain-containing protein n=1 Tax=Chryseobacterium arthrosphaerae TaxID=651561 RepID=UPI000F4E0CFC|nr:ankyrin repeat domain-containing protein [Chryseobacterium arthrosphaerae]AYZ13272.1 ankyrin repeat domain-containing protein [Chryseobacterium arthrosphaerae]